MFIFDKPSVNGCNVSLSWARQCYLFIHAFLAYLPHSFLHWMTPKVHMLVHHVPEYVHRTGIQLGPTSEQAPKSQHTFFDIFYHRLVVSK